MAVHAIHRAPDIAVENPSRSGQTTENEHTPTQIPTLAAKLEFRSGFVTVFFFLIYYALNIKLLLRLDN